MPPAKHVVHAYRAATIVVTDICILLIVLFGVTLLDWAVAYASSFTNHGGDLLIYDRFPLRYLFQTIDVALIITFGTLAVIDVIKIFRDRD
jgi:hypothetical protein